MTRQSDPLRHLKWPLRLTHAGLVAERAVRSFWPLLTVVLVILAILMFGWHETATVELFWAGAVLAALGLILTLGWGLRVFDWPSHAQAVARVDASMPGHPISAMTDMQAIGSSDPASQAVWQAHVSRMEDRARSAKASAPNLKVSDRDPYSLRFIALLFFVCALLFGSIWRVGTVAEIAQNGQVDALASGPVWEGWVAPPGYTGKPTIYLNDIAPGPLRVPEGSEVTLRLYGEVGALTVAETVSGRTEDLDAASEPQQTFTIAGSGSVSVIGDEQITWNIIAVGDAPPMVELSGPVEADADGEMTQPFRAMDDYGVASGTATITLDLPSVERAYGLTIDPDGFDPLVLDLPIPFTGDRDDFDDFLVANLSEHPLANLPVVLTLEVEDETGQVSTADPESIVLPGRRFFQPFARAVIEQRRDLMWSKANGLRIAQVLRAISNRPEGLFSNETTYLRLRAIIRQIEGAVGDMDDDTQDEVVQAMWDLAIQLEDGTLADARERLRRAQERLSEAMRNGASQEEIAELMDELRAATDDYMQMLADQMEPGESGTDQPDMAENSTEFTQDELQALMDRIEELMNEGRMEEAQALMERLNELMENLQITQGEGGEGGPRTPGQQSMEDLQDTLRDQQQLSDDAFRDLQERTNPREEGNQQQGQEGQQGQQQDGSQQGQQQGESQQGEQQGQGQSTGEEGQQGQQSGEGQGGEGSDTDQRGLSERQQALREELERQRGNLPSLDGESGDAAEGALDRAEGAMENAEGALERGDLAEAIDQQGEALDALRDGMRALSQALADNQQDQQPGQGNEQGEATGRVEPSDRDPLGRELGNTGQFGTDENLLQGEDVYRRAEELLNELRRRSADQERPELEKDYLRRLLDRF